MISRNSENPIHREIKLRYREYFESKLANELIGKPALFPSVYKVSTAIINLIKKYQQAILNLIQSDSKIAMDLYDPKSSGRLPNTQAKPEAILKDIVNALDNPYADLEVAILIQGIFIFRIYPYLMEKENTKNEFQKLNSVISQQLIDDSRLEIKSVKSNSLTGVCKNPVFMKMFKPTYTHIRGIDCFNPNNNSYYTKNAEEKNIPFAAGPSGHTRTLMVGAKLYGNLSTEELTEYSLAIFAAFVYGGHHTFQEVMIIANQFGVPFKDNSYTTSIPQSIKQSKPYVQLSKLFPEFLDEENQMNQSESKHIEIKKTGNECQCKFQMY